MISSFVLCSLCLLPSLATVKAQHSPVSLGGYSYTNKGPVAFGVIPADHLDPFDDSTIGGVGSAIAIKPGTWSRDPRTGSYRGTLVTHTDSGPHGTLKTGYQVRQHEFTFTLSPYYGTTNLNFTSARSTLRLFHSKTIPQVDSDGRTLVGMDPNGVRPARPGWPALPIFDSSTTGAASASSRTAFIVVDAEGLVLDTDGSYWVSDEYGPYIYHFNAKSPSKLIGVTAPPRAFLPLDAAGQLDFTSVTNPKSGRVVGQGFEGLTMDFQTRTLYAMLQSALVQDGGADESGAETDTTSRYTRLTAFDASRRSGDLSLKGEWIVPLPRSSSKNKTRASSEILFVGDGTFLTYARDGDGRGGNGDKSSTKQIDLFSIKSATNIAGTKFDDPANPAAPLGVLSSEITPAEYASFVEIINSGDLAKFGLHNGSPNDWTLIASRWEGLAIAPVCDNENKDDYFVFAASDNNFASTHGWAVGVPFDDGIDVDSQFLVYRLTLPSVPRGSVERGLGIPPCFKH